MPSTSWERRFEHDVEEVLLRLRRSGTVMPRSLPLHVAVLYCGKSAVSSESNLYARHAEINCMRRLDRARIKRHKPLRLVVSKISGEHRMSRPCRACCVEIRRRLPSARVFYTDRDGTLCEDITLDNDHISLSERNGQKTTRRRPTCSAPSPSPSHGT